MGAKSASGDPGGQAGLGDLGGQHGQGESRGQHGQGESGGPELRKGVGGEGGSVAKGGGRARGASGAEARWSSPESYFKLEAGHFLWELWPGGAPVWEALDRLKALIRAKIRPNVSKLRAKGSLVLENAAVAGGEAIFGVDYRQGEGGLAVFKDGVEIEGAALVLAGAFIADDLVELGPGAVVETGAMLKGPAIIGAGAGRYARRPMSGARHSPSRIARSAAPHRPKTS